MNKILKTIYNNSPMFVQNIAKHMYGKIPIPIRYGKTFREMYAFLQESQWWSREQLEKYQLQQLGNLLRHAYRNVPYYTKVFDEHGLKPMDIKTLDDLQKLPYLTKELVKDNLDDLIARNYPKSKLLYDTTGGSTGISLELYRDAGSVAKVQAFVWTLWDRVGYKFRDRCVILTGNVVKSSEKGKFWEYDPINKGLVLSSYHMADENLPAYIEKIRMFKPKFIYAYPTTISNLARFMKEHNIAPFLSVNAVLCSSENIYQSQRELLEDVFKCRVYSTYGSTEQVVIAGECEKSTCYHISPEYGITELIGKDGTAVTKEDELGEIVGTGFNNYAMPLIRYKTMDWGVYTNQKCGCGRNYPLLKRVEGRLHELIYTRNNELISLGPAAFSIYSEEWGKLKQIQFVQKEKGKLIIRILRDVQGSEQEIKSYVLRVFGLKLKPLCDIDVEFVDKIPMTKRGKYRFLIQELPIEFGRFSKWNINLLKNI